MFFDVLLMTLDAVFCEALLYHLYICMETYLWLLLSSRKIGSKNQQVKMVTFPQCIFYIISTIPSL